MTGRPSLVRAALVLAACVSFGPQASPAPAATTAESHAAGSIPDSAVSRGNRQATRRHRTPGQALGIGVAITTVPAIATVVAFSTKRPENATLPGALAVGATAGMVLGPAIGLASGGRRDLAADGLMARTVGTCILALGLGFAWSSIEGGDTAHLPPAAIVLGGAGGALLLGSCVHDLAITRSAVAERRAPRVLLGLRPDGVVSVGTTF